MLCGVCAVSSRNKRRVKSETDSGPAPSAPPQGANMVTSSDNFPEPSLASELDKTAMPVCFQRSLSVEDARVSYVCLCVCMYMCMHSCMCVYICTSSILLSTSTVQVLMSERDPGSYVVVPSTFRRVQRQAVIKVTRHS